MVAKSFEYVKNYKPYYNGIKNNLKTMDDDQIKDPEEIDPEIAEVSEEEEEEVGDDEVV